jgi:hypothetical protein
MSFNWWKRPEVKTEVKPQSKSYYPIKVKIQAAEPSEPNEAQGTAEASGDLRTADANDPAKEAPTNLCGQEAGYAS